ncbi:hypothetical protein NHJ13734_003362 [Beauveria thailandica]
MEHGGDIDMFDSGGSVRVGIWDDGCNSDQDVDGHSSGNLARAGNGGGGISSESDILVLGRCVPIGRGGYDISSRSVVDEIKVAARDSIDRLAFSVTPALLFSFVAALLSSDQSIGRRVQFDLLTTLRSHGLRSICSTKLRSMASTSSHPPYLNCQTSSATSKAQYSA